MAATQAVVRPDRNDPCHCNSGKKYKKCCLEKDTLELTRALKYIANSPELSSKYRVIANDRDVVLYPWERPGFAGVGKYRVVQDEAKATPAAAALAAPTPAEPAPEA